MELISQFFNKETIIVLFILLAVILIVPILCERLKLPGILGLVGAGVVLGPSGWNLLDAELPVMHLLSDIGLSYLIFVAGLEFNIQLFSQVKTHSFVYGCFAFGLSLILGTWMGLITGLSWDISILIGCLMSSYTTLAYPLLMRLGLATNEAINVVIGATIFSNLGTLIILAIFVGGSHNGSFNLSKLISILIILTIYILIVIIGFDWGCKEFFRRYGDDESNKFVYVLIAVFLANFIGQCMEVERALSFFITGLLVNKTIGESPVKGRLVYVGSVVFIPIFFIDSGLLLDMPNLVQNYRRFTLFLLMFLSLIFSRFVGAMLAKIIYRYNWQETLTIWSLSIPLMYTTLAIALEGYRSHLLPQYIVSGAIILILVTSTMGSWLTDWIVKGNINANSLLADQPTSIDFDLFEPYSASKDMYFKNISIKNIIVHVQKSQTYPYLIELSALLTQQNKGKIVPLAIAPATAHMDAPSLEDICQSKSQLLEKATIHSQALGSQADPLLRIDNALAPGITRAARERKASLIVMDWGKRSDLRAGLFGNVIDSVLWSAHCPVAVARLVDSPQKIQRILVPIENLLTPTLKPVQLAQMLADANQAHLTLLNMCDRHTSSGKITARRSRLLRLIAQLDLPNPPEIQVIVHESMTQAILQAARLYDLVILPFTRNHSYQGGLVVSDLTTELAKHLTCSIIILGEPQTSQIIIRHPFSKTLPVKVQKPHLQRSKMG